MQRVEHGTEILGIVLVICWRFGQVEYGGDSVECVVEDASRVDGCKAVDADHDCWDRLRGLG